MLGGGLGSELTEEPQTRQPGPFMCIMQCKSGEIPCASRNPKFGEGGGEYERTMGHSREEGMELGKKVELGISLEE